jgi:uncharacterized membrane protein
VTAVWVTIAALTVGTFLSKALGTLVLGAREPGPRMLAVTALLAPALLTALVIYQTFGASGGGMTVDARAVGLVAALVAIRARASMLVVILIAAAATAAVRAFT